MQSQVHTSLKYPDDFINKAVNMECLEAMKLIPDESVNCVVTSPPYWGLRDYGVEGQLGLEKTPEEYVEKVVKIFRETRRILRSDGTLWLNLGDRMIKKNLLGLPWRIALALQSEGWYIRSEIIWNKPGPVPESCTDRPTRAHEHIFLMSKSAKYWYDADAIKEDAITYEERPAGVVRDREYDYDSKSKAMGRHKNLQPKGQEPHTMHKNRLRHKDMPRGSFNGKNGDMAFRAIREKVNKRDVWTVPFEPFPGAHFAPFPTKLIEPCILAGCPSDGIVLDIFGGSGTTGQVAEKHGRDWIMIELNPKYIKLINNRTAQKSLFKQEI